MTLVIETQILHLHIFRHSALLYQHITTTQINCFNYKHASASNLTQIRSPAAKNISRDEVYVGTTLVSQALSAGRVSPMLAASKKYIPLDPASSTVIRTG